MGGKLPIDRAREAKHDPRRIEEEKQAFSEKEARLRRKARQYDDEVPGEEREGREGEGQDEDDA